MNPRRSNAVHARPTEDTQVRCDFGREFVHGVHYVGESARDGYRLYACKRHRKAVKWAWLRRIEDKAFPSDPNTERLAYPRIGIRSR